MQNHFFLGISSWQFFFKKNTANIFLHVTVIFLHLGSRAFSAPNARPNILFIVVDDQSPFDLQVYNRSSTLETPVISQLAAEGMVFDSAYHMGAWVGGVCTPSRHMIMSGRTLGHIPDKPGRLNNPHAVNPHLVPPDLS